MSAARPGRTESTTSRNTLHNCAKSMSRCFVISLLGVRVLPAAFLFSQQFSHSVFLLSRCSLSNVNIGLYDLFSIAYQTRRGESS